ncbi:unnamed protein product, partial [Polarella glacialis]
VVDGFKPGQRKILYCAFKRNLKSDIKVAQFAGYIAEHSAYHHGEVSLQGTIVGMAQTFVGANNINLLTPSGQFGTRLQGGKDSASARYIYTKLEKIARIVFHPDDDPLLEQQTEEGQVIEPVWYMPVIPMALVNGADGIGTGWSTSLPNYNPRFTMKLYIKKKPMGRLGRVSACLGCSLALCLAVRRPAGSPAVRGTAFCAAGPSRSRAKFWAPRDHRRPPQRLAAAPEGLEAALFSISSQANEAVQSALAASGDGSSPYGSLVLLPLLFAAGVASSLNPCNAAQLPAAAASVAALSQDRAGAFAQALAYAAGSASVLVGLGLALSLAGERLPSGAESPLLWLFPLVAIVMGLTLLGVLPLSVPRFSFGGQDAASAAPRELQGFLLGATSAASSSPCATPVLVTVTSYLAAHQQSGPFSAVLLLAYALGYSTPLAVISLSASSLPWLQAGSRWGPLVSGAAILAVGSFQLLGAVREAFGAGGSDLLIEASAAVAVLLAVLLRSEAAEPAVV